MSWSTKQNNVISFMNSLELFGIEKGLPIRVLDSIRELKAEMEQVTDELSFSQLILQIDPLLKHIGKKYSEAAGTEVIPVCEGGDSVSMEEVADRIKEIIDDCLAENRDKCRIYSAEQEPLIQELENGIRELCHTDTHYKKIRNAGKFQSFYYSIESKYHNRLADSLNSYANIIWQGCDTAISKVKAMLTKLKDPRLHVSEREFWTIFGNKEDLIKRRIQAAAKKLPAQQNIVTEWAATMIPQLNQSRKKLFWNRLIRIVAPFIGILAIMLAVTLISKIKETDSSLSTNNQKAESSSTTNNEEMDALELLLSKGIDKISDNSEKVSEVESGKIKLLKIMLIAALIILALYVAVYIPLMMSLTKNQFCDEVAAYLAPETEQFIKNNNLRDVVEENFEYIKNEAEQAYQEIMAIVLDKTAIPQTMQVYSESEEFWALCRQWETIKRA